MPSKNAGWNGKNGSGLGKVDGLHPRQDEHRHLHPSRHASPDYEEPLKPDHAQTLTWKDEVDGWTYTLHASWLYQKGDPDELWHDVHVTARKKGERHTFSVWFEKEGEHYKAV